MKEYRLRPVEAFQYWGQPIEELQELCPLLHEADARFSHDLELEQPFGVLFGNTKVNKSDWLVHSYLGWQVMSDAEFFKLYEAVE